MAWANGGQSSQRITHEQGGVDDMNLCDYFAGHVLTALVTGLPIDVPPVDTDAGRLEARWHAEAK